MAKVTPKLLTEKPKRRAGRPEDPEISAVVKDYAERGKTITRIYAAQVLWRKRMRKQREEKCDTRNTQESLKEI